MNDDELESNLRQLRPRAASRELRARLATASPGDRRTPVTWLPWRWSPILRLGFAAIVLGLLSSFLLPKQPSEESRPAQLPPPPGHNGTMAVVNRSTPTTFVPVETNRLILSSQPIGTMTGPDDTPLELRRVRWLDYSRSLSPDGDQLVVGYPSEEIIPVALTIH